MAETDPEELEELELDYKGRVILQVIHVNI